LEQWIRGVIQLTNEGDEPIEGWSVSWSYPDGSTAQNSWNAQLSGNNPYSASNIGWNSVIQPGQTVEFGMSVNKAERGTPVITTTVKERICQQIV